MKKSIRLFKLTLLTAAAIAALLILLIVVASDGSDERTQKPDDVSYSVIETNTIPGIKRSLDVRMNRKVPEDVLRAIALKLKAGDSRKYQRTFISYYLPGMKVGGGAWATSHFDPTLSVRILGLTAKEEKTLAAKQPPADQNVIGQWIDERPFVASRITIFREGSSIYIEQVFKDGSRLKKEVVEKKSSHGWRFDMIEVSSSGDHWVIDSRGILQIRDNEGLIATAKKIK